MQRKEKIDFNWLKQMMIQGQKQLQNCKEQSIVVIGKTGSGKSCLVNLLIGNNLKFIHKTRTQVKFSKEKESKGPQIGNTMSSQTTIPNYWKGKDDLFYWDCPGFHDNKKPQQDICNSLLIQKLFDRLKQIKILIVFCHKDFDLDRGVGLIELIKNICRLFIDINQSLPMLQIAITKCPQDFKKIEIEQKLSSVLQQVKQIQEPHKQIINTLKTNYEKHFSIFYKPPGKIEQQGIISENEILDVKQILKEIKYMPTPKIKPLIKQSNINLIYEQIDVLRKNYSILLQKILQQFQKRLKNIRSEKVLKTFLEQQDKIKRSSQNLFNNKYIFQKQMKQNHNFKSYNQFFGDFLACLFKNQESENKKQLENCWEGLIFFSRFIKNSQQILDIGFNFVSSIYKVFSERFLQLLKQTQNQGNTLIDEIKKRILQSLQNAKNFSKDLLIKGNKQIQKLNQYLFKQEGEKIIFKIIEVLENLFYIQVNLPQKFQIHNQIIKKFLQYGHQTVKFQKLKLVNCLGRIQKFVNNKIGQFKYQQLQEKMKEQQNQFQKRYQQLLNKIKQSQNQQNKQRQKLKSYVLKNIQQKDYKVNFQNKTKNKLIISKHDIKFSEIQQKIMGYYKNAAINDVKDLKNRIKQKEACKQFIIILQAGGTIEIDIDKFSVYTSICIMAPLVKFLRKTTFTLKGPSGKSMNYKKFWKRQSHKNDDLYCHDDKSIRGKNGQNGSHGMPGGLFIIVADEIEGLHNLSINNDGGSGGDGQSGQSGSDYVGKHLLYASQGIGGNGGNGGNGGHKGVKGQVLIMKPDQNIHYKEHKIQASTSKDGQGGQGGQSGKGWNIQKRSWGRRTEGKSGVRGSTGLNGSKVTGHEIYTEFSNDYKDQLSINSLKWIYNDYYAQTQYHQTNIKPLFGNEN